MLMWLVWTQGSMGKCLSQCWLSNSVCKENVLLSHGRISSSGLCKLMNFWPVKGNFTPGVIGQHLHVGSYYLGHGCVCVVLIYRWRKSLVRMTPVLAAGNGESSCLTWRGMREETQWKGNSCLGNVYHTGN